MFKKESSYTHTADDTIRKVGAVVPLILFIDWLLISFNLMVPPNYAGTLVFFCILAGFIALGIYQAIIPSKTALISALRLSGFHLLAICSGLFITGTQSSFIILWIILMLASYTYFDKKGLKYNIVAFATFIILNILLWHPTNLILITSDIMRFIIITIVGVIVIVVNRTHEIKQRELYESKIQESLQRDRVAAIVNNLTDAIFSTDSNGIIKVYNASCLNLLDTNINLIGHNIDKILPLFDLAKKEIRLTNLLFKSKSVVQRDDLRYIFNNGEEIRIALTYTPIRRGYSNTKRSEIHDGYIIILRDITKQKSLDEERDDFLSVISHELRTPITTAEGSISNLQFMIKLPNIKIEVLEKPIDTAHEQIMFLANLVNDLSALSRAERGVGSEVEEVNVNELCKSVIDKYIEDADKKKVILKLDISKTLKTISTSKLYINELLQNLISNAVKYTKKGSVVLKIIDSTNYVTFSVIDTGIGISKTDQDKIFGKFYRSEDYRTRETGGTGLGLFIAQQLAVKLGSKIIMESELNKGSTFSFKLKK